MQRLRGGLGESVRPQLAGQHLPDRARGTRLGQRRQELPAAAICLPSRPVDGCYCGRCWRRSIFTFYLGMSGRYRQPQHVGAGAGIASRDGVNQPTDLRGEHRFGGHDAVQPRQLADVIGFGPAFQDEPVDQPAVEAQPHPHTGLRVVGLLRGHQIVEVAIQMRHRQHRQHSRDRFECGGLPSPRGHSPGVAGFADTRPKKKPAVIRTCAAA